MLYFSKNIFNELLGSQMTFNQSIADKRFEYLNGLLSTYMEWGVLSWAILGFGHYGPSKS